MIEEKRKDCKECVSHLLMESHLEDITKTAGEAHKMSSENGRRLEGHGKAGVVATIFVGAIISGMVLFVTSSKTDCAEDIREVKADTVNRVDNVLVTMRLLITKLDEISVTVNNLERNTAVISQRIENDQRIAEKERNENKRRIENLEKMGVRRAE